MRQSLHTPVHLSSFVLSAVPLEMQQAHAAVAEFSCSLLQSHIVSIRRCVETQQHVTSIEPSHMCLMLGLATVVQPCTTWTALCSLQLEQVTRMFSPEVRLWLLM
jgi:hypothetical protein